VHTRGRAPYSGGGGDRGPGGPGGPRGDRPWSPGGGTGGFRGGPAGSQPNQQGSDDWGDDRRSRGDRRAKKKAVKTGPTGTWDEDAMRMRAPQKREKRESGRTWRDYTADEDFDETRPPGEEEEAVADGEEKVEGETVDAAVPGEDGAVADERPVDPDDVIEPGTSDDEDDEDLH
jgi:hypothetical protein